MASLFTSKNEDGNYEKKYLVWNPLDVPRGKTGHEFRYGKKRVESEIEADQELTGLYIRHQKVVSSDLDKRKVEIEGIHDPRTLKPELEDSGPGELEEIGESLGRLVADLHRNGKSHGDPHLDNFLYDDGEIIPFDHEFYSSEASLSGMKDDLRLIETDARTLQRETYQNLISHFKSRYLTELKPEDDLVTYETELPDNYEEELEDFLEGFAGENNFTTGKYGLTRILGARGQDSRRGYFSNFVRNSFGQREGEK